MASSGVLRTLPNMLNANPETLRLARYVPHKPILTSRQGYAAYLLIVDSKTRQVWVFNTKTKEPPIKMVDLFLQRYGLKDGTQRYIRTNLGGGLTNSQEFRPLIAQHGYRYLVPVGNNRS
jgi:hypothetical protein